MRVADVVERVVKNRTERSVHSAEGSAQPSPLLISEVGHEHVRVLQIGYQNKVVVDDHVRNQVIECHGGETCMRNSINETKQIKSFNSHTKNVNTVSQKS